MQKLFKIFLIISILFTPVFIKIHAEETGIPDPTPILGCTDPLATVNYNPLATQDDGSCIYPEIKKTPDPVSIRLTISNNSGALFDQDMEVKACDSDNPAVGILKVTAYCAVIQSGLAVDWNTAWAPGIFLNSINNISSFTTQDKDGLDVYHYWSWSANGTEAMVGLNQYDLISGDKITLTFIDPKTEVEVEKQVEIFHGSGGGGSTKIEEKKEIQKIFNSQKALEFLASQQKTDSIFGEELYTDWATLAFASNKNFQDQKIKLLRYFSENKPNNVSLTDYERHVMALLALGLNPYKVNNENHIAKILSYFDGTQFGEINQDNDDIFALIVLQNAGFTIEDKDEIILKTINFILSKQQTNGSWDNNVDMTGASMEALANFKNIENNTDLKITELSEKIQTALNNAKNYLKEKQDKNTAGWENVSSTAWAIQGILALGEKIEDWKIGENTPETFLFDKQDETDGSIKVSETENLESKIWQTSYAVTSLSGKTWNQILEKFEKPANTELENLVNKNLKNTNQNSDLTNQEKFIKKVQKFQKPALELPEITEAITPEKTEIIKKDNFFQKILKVLFGF